MGIDGAWIAAQVMRGASRRGGQIYFQANPDNPIYAELRSLVVKTSGVADVLRAALGPLAERVSAAPQAATAALAASGFREAREAAASLNRCFGLGDWSSLALARMLQDPGLFHCG